MKVKVTKRKFQQVHSIVNVVR